MRNCTLYGARIADMDALHTALSEGLGFPAWYGRNLDALYDLLTEPMEPVTLTIYDFETLSETLGEKGAALRRVLNDAGQENEALTVLLLGHEDEI